MASTKKELEITALAQDKIIKTQMDKLVKLKEEIRNRKNKYSDLEVRLRNLESKNQENYVEYSEVLYKLKQIKEIL